MHPGLDAPGPNRVDVGGYAVRERAAGWSAADLLDHLRHRLGDRPGGLEEGDPEGGQLHPLAGANQELDADLAFETIDPAPKCLPRYAESLGGVRVVRLFGDDEKGEDQIPGLY